MTDQRTLQLSKRLTWLLRHGAEKSNLPLRADGFALFSDIIKSGNFGKSLDEEKVLQIVESDKKGRFGILRDTDGNLLIRANQGHTLKSVDREKLLTEVTDADLYPYCIHGTTLEAWNEIKTKGLRKMKRNEIHFAKGEFGTVLSGFRPGSQVLIYINLPLCLAEGIRFYESENGVLLSPGLGSDGVIPTGFFLKVITAKDQKELEFQPSF